MELVAVPSAVNYITHPGRLINPNFGNHWPTKKKSSL